MDSSQASQTTFETGDDLAAFLNCGRDTQEELLAEAARVLRDKPELLDIYGWEYVPVVLPMCSADSSLHDGAREILRMASSSASPRELVLGCMSSLVVEAGQPRLGGCALAHAIFLLSSAFQRLSTAHVCRFLTQVLPGVAHAIWSQRFCHSARTQREGVEGNKEKSMPMINAADSARDFSSCEEQRCDVCEGSDAMVRAVLTLCRGVVDSVLRCESVQESHELAVLVGTAWLVLSNVSEEQEFNAIAFVELLQGAGVRRSGVLTVLRQGGGGGERRAVNSEEAVAATGLSLLLAQAMDLSAGMQRVEAMLQEPGGLSWGKADAVLFLSCPVVETLLNCRLPEAKNGRELLELLLDPIEASSLPLSQPLSAVAMALMTYAATHDVAEERQAAVLALHVVFDALEPLPRFLLLRSAVLSAPLPGLVEALLRRLRRELARELVRGSTLRMLDSRDLAQRFAAVCSGSTGRMGDSYFVFFTPLLFDLLAAVLVSRFGLGGVSLVGGRPSRLRGGTLVENVDMILSVVGVLCAAFVPGSGRRVGRGGTWSRHDDVMVSAVANMGAGVNVGERQLLQQEDSSMRNALLQQSLDSIRRLMKHLEPVAAALDVEVGNVTVELESLDNEGNDAERGGGDGGRGDDGDVEGIAEASVSITAAGGQAGDGEEHLQPATREERRLFLQLARTKLELAARTLGPVLRTAQAI